MDINKEIDNIITSQYKQYNENKNANIDDVYR